MKFAIEKEEKVPMEYVTNFDEVCKATLYPNYTCAE